MHLVGKYYIINIFFYLQYLFKYLFKEEEINIDFTHSNNTEPYNKRITLKELNAALRTTKNSAPNMI